MLPGVYFSFTKKAPRGPLLVERGLITSDVVDAIVETYENDVGPMNGARVVAQANNTSGVIGIRPRYVLFSAHPYLYFVASWSVDGKARSTSFSSERHGKMVALKMAMDRREKATGVKYDLTPRQALNRMKHLLSAA